MSSGALSPPAISTVFTIYICRRLWTTYTRSRNTQQGGGPEELMPTSLFLWTQRQRMAWTQEEKTTNLCTSQQTWEDTGSSEWNSIGLSEVPGWIFSPIVVQKILYRRRALASSIPLLTGQPATLHARDEECRNLISLPSLSLSLSYLFSNNTLLLYYPKYYFFKYHTCKTVERDRGENYILTEH